MPDMLHDSWGTTARRRITRPVWIPSREAAGLKAYHPLRGDTLKFKQNPSRVKSKVSFAGRELVEYSTGSEKERGGPATAARAGPTSVNGTGTLITALDDKRGPDGNSGL